MTTTDPRDPVRPLLPDPKVAAPARARAGRAAHDVVSEVARQERRRLVVALLCMGLLMAAAAASSCLPSSGWPTATLSVIVNLAVAIGLALRSRDATLGRLLLFGLAFGVGALAADAYLSDVAGTLDYSIDGGGPRLWRSPVYLPFAWQVVVMQLAVVGAALQARLGRAGIALTGLLAAASIPVYDELARGARWWRWVDCRMIHNVPCHLVASYALIGVLISWSAMRLLRSGPSWPRAVTCGALAGLATLPICALTSALLG